MKKWFFDDLLNKIVCCEAKVDMMLWCSHLQTTTPRNNIMSTSILYHTQGIRDFNHVSFHYHEGVVEERIKRKCQLCPVCGSPMFRPTGVAHVL